MSKKNIDFSKPLSEDDAQYVKDRPWLIQDAILAGETVRTADEFYVGEDDEDEEPEGFQDDSDEGGSEESDGSDEEPEDEDDAPDYSTWEYQDLKDEAGRRDLPKSGSKEQLINRLEAYDRERGE